LSDETANGNIENVDDLEAFEKDFFGTKTPEVEEDVADETEIEAEEAETDDVDPVDTDEDEDETEAEDSDDSEEEEEVEKPKRNRKTAQERIKELTTEKYEAQRREVETLRRLRELEEKLAAPKEEAKEPVKEVTDAPSPDATGADGEPLYPLGEFDPAYIRALTRFTIKQETDAAQKAEATRREQEAIQNARTQAQEVWSGRLEEAKKDVPDLVDKITSLATTFDHLPADYGQYLVDIVQSLDNGPHILAYLADNPKEAQQIVSSGATSATLSLGRLDARLARAAVKEKVVKVTNAPVAPPKIARGTGKASTSADTDDLAAFEKQFFRKK
jgi:hypothetical protein